MDLSNAPLEMDVYQYDYSQDVQRHDPDDDIVTYSTAAAHSNTALEGDAAAAHSNTAREGDAAADSNTAPDGDAAADSMVTPQVNALHDATPDSVVRQESTTHQHEATAAEDRNLPDAQHLSLQELLDVIEAKRTGLAVPDVVANPDYLVNLPPSMGEFEKHHLNNVIFIGDKALPGYHSAFIADVGASTTPGLRTGVEVYAGVGSTQSVRINLAFGSAGTVNIGEVIIPIETATPIRINTSDDASGAENRAHIIRTLQGAETVDLKWHKQHQETKFVGQELEHYIEDKFLAEVIVVGPIICEWNQTFWKLIDQAEEKTAVITRSIREVLDNAAAQGDVRVTFYHSRGQVMHAWRALSQDHLLQEPFQPFLGENTLSQLGWTSAVLPVDHRPRNPEKVGCNVFVSPTHRGVSLMVGAVDEAVFDTWRILDCAKYRRNFALVPVPGSEWTDGTASGINATNHFTQYYGFTPLPKPVKPAGQKSYTPSFPDIGEVVVLDFADMPVKLHDIPTGIMPDNVVSNAADMIIDFLSRGAIKAKHSSCAAQNWLDEKLSEEPGFDVSIYESPDDAAQTTLENYFLEHMDVFVNACGLEGPHRDAHIVTESISLMCRDGEDDITHRTRIVQWVRTQGFVATEVDHVALRKFKARRLAQPLGASLPFAVFRIVLPGQPGYPAPYSPPPIMISVQPVLADSWDTLNSKLKDASVMSCSARIEMEHNYVSLQAECGGFARLLDVRQGSRLGRLMLYTNDFKTTPRDFDLLARFPALQAGIDVGTYTGEHLKAIESLASTRDGFVIVQGGPGTGKTFLALLIATAVYRSGALSTTTVEVMPDVPTTSEVFEQEMEALALTEPAVPQATAVPTALPIEEGFTVPAGPQIDESIAMSDVSQDSEQPSSPTEHGVPTQAQHMHIVWTVGQNTQRDDAHTRFMKMNPEATSVCMHPWLAEFDALLSQEPRDAPKLPNADLQGLDKDLAFNAFYDDVGRYEQNNPGLNLNSLSSIIKNDATLMSTDMGQLVLQAQVARARRDPAYIANQTLYREAARSLMITKLHSVNIVFSTPVAFSQYAVHMDPVNGYQPDLLIVDEVGRQTEAMTMLHLAYCPKTPIIMLGDRHQFGPIVPPASEPRWKGFFTAQRQKTLLSRYSMVGACDITLRDNHRARGSCTIFAQRQFYKNDMVLTQKEDAEADAFTAWLQSQGGADFRPDINFVCVHVKAAREESHGTSWQNWGHVNWVVYAAADLARRCPLARVEDLHLPVEQQRRAKILIICAYAAQKRLYDWALSRLTPVQCPPGLISVRTIDDSPSHEAEITLVDLVRTSQPGFIGDRERLAVACTRAIYGTIVVVGEDVHSPHINALRNFADDYQALVQVRSFDRFCYNCRQPGHITSDCRHPAFPLSPAASDLATNPNTLRGEQHFLNPFKPYNKEERSEDPEARRARPLKRKGPSSKKTKVRDKGGPRREEAQKIDEHIMGAGNTGQTQDDATTADVSGHDNVHSTSYPADAPAGLHVGSTDITVDNTSDALQQDATTAGTVTACSYNNGVLQQTGTTDADTDTDGWGNDTEVPNAGSWSDAVPEADGGW